MKTLTVLLLLGAGLIMLFIFKKTGHFFKSLFLSVLGGVGSLCAAGALSYFVPLSVGINSFTLAFCSVFSVPGTVLLLVAKAFLL